jgi:glutamine amidotransferase
LIAIIDYGLGNIQAFANIYKRLNYDILVAHSSEELIKADKIILPGVGAFDWAMKKLNESGMRECLDDLVVVKKKPVLGICVGMQIIAGKSEEGVLEGLGWVDAEVKKFDVNSTVNRIQLPQMGWNDVHPKHTKCLFKNLETGSKFYFLHSYYFLSKNDTDVLATTDYNCVYASSIRHDNIFGVQFHPEKSHQWGIQLLKNFAEL